MIPMMIHSLLLDLVSTDTLSSSRLGLPCRPSGMQLPRRSILSGSCPGMIPLVSPSRFEALPPKTVKVHTHVSLGNFTSRATITLHFGAT